MKFIIIVNKSLSVYDASVFLLSLLLTLKILHIFSSASILEFKHLKVISATKLSLLKMYYLKHRLINVLLCRKVTFRSQDIQVFLFSTVT